MPDLLIVLAWVMLGLGAVLLGIVVLFALAVFIGAIEGGSYDDDLYLDEEDLKHLKNK